MSRNSIFDDGNPVVIIRNLNADDIQALACHAVFGAPQPTALLGFMHALARKMGMPGIFSTISLISHEFGIAKGFPKHPGKTEPAPIMDDPKAYMRFSIILRTNDVATDDCLTLPAIVERAVMSMRISGSTLWKSEGSVVVKTGAGDIGAILSGMKNSCVLMDRTNILPLNGTGEDSLASLLNFLSASRNEVSGNFERPLKGWLVPLLVGYRAISKPRRISGLRGNAPEHAWVEEILGLGQWIPLSKARREDFSSCLWGYEKTGTERGLFLATALSN